MMWTWTDGTELYHSAWVILPKTDYLCHYRTKGSKNGVRRYQNTDGTWTELGKERRRLEYKKHNVVKQELKKGTVSKNLHEGRQDKHIRGSNNYIEGRSYIYGDREDARKLIDKYSGTGKGILDNKANWTKKERIKCDEPIGVCNSEDGKRETSSGIIIYSKDGAHIIPGKDEDHA